MAIPKALSEQDGLQESANADLHVSGKEMTVEARSRPRHKLTDLIAEMPNGLPRVQGWEGTPSVGLEDC
ncbi:AbrB/MazE/SpoVT family DNA-binding domain-containing protein [Cupriavidus sp. TMH.W2]|uniref:AbrB/MazE/SpoVT family DNA-binding domain-containing protein n=1 Tax=Cupriavidus sp. TMH.W2 TaxID=3434465 RepID=UPI003D76FB2F